MPSEYLLDSNTAIYYLQGNPKVVSVVESHRIHYLPFMTVAELLYGAKRSARPADNLGVYVEFISRFSILYPGRQTLETHSDLRVTLKEMGRPIPANDVWQAALALEHDAVLVTNDRHFSAVPGLRVENWVL
jgi:tRNA(fMet)-specific endonuclease VapC